MEYTKKDLQMFITLGDTKNITKTANQLYISQPAISYRLSQWEQQLGESLCIRTTRGIRLTEAGEMLYNFAKTVLQEEQHFIDQLQESQHMLKGTLHIGSSSIFANYHLPAILEGFSQLHRHVQIHLYTGISSDISQKFNNNQIDIAFIRGEQKISGQKLFLSKEPLCLVTAKTTKQEDLLQLPQIRYTTDPSLYTIMDTWCKENFDTPPLHSIYLDSMATCRHFIKRNLGWAILPYTGLESLGNDLQIQPLYWKTGDPIERETSMYYHDITPQRKTTAAFIDYLKNYYKSE